MTSGKTTDEHVSLHKIPSWRRKEEMQNGGITQVEESMRAALLAVSLTQVSDLISLTHVEAVASFRY